MDTKNQIIIYNTADGQTKIEVTLKGETVWLSQKQMAELFDCSVDNIRINSLRGMQFRIWATQKLKEYIVKGFTMDDERLANGKVAKTYFQEWEERIRKIRTSEANFYQKVRDVFATSADYNPKADYAQKFFVSSFL